MNYQKLFVLLVVSLAVVAIAKLSILSRADKITHTHERNGNAERAREDNSKEPASMEECNGPYNLDGTETVR